MKELCHHIRNATMGIEGLFCHLDEEKRKQVREQLKRIENALFAYQEREKKKNVHPGSFQNP